MFGYVKVLKPEMKVREYELYSSTYCGLCRAMGKCTGQCSRLALSYDMVFLALARIGNSGDSVELGKATCIAHPFRKRAYMKRNPTLDYCAAAAAILNYHKIGDDLSDERGAKRMAAAAAFPIAAYGRKRALRQGYGELDGTIGEKLAELSRIEEKRLPSVNEPARVFGDILGELFSYGVTGDGGRILRELGCSVGRWIYIADALDDWQEDAKRGRYNPFALLYGKEKPDEHELEGIRIAMKNELVSAESAYDLMDIENRDVKNVIENILFSGLPSRVEEIAKKGNNPKGNRTDDRPL